MATQKSSTKAAPKTGTNKGTPKTADDKTAKGAAAQPAPETPAVIDAAVHGQLKPNLSAAGQKDQEALTKRSSNDRPTGRPVGVKTGLGVQAAWCYYFQVNEKAPAGKKMTDEEITAAMKADFPGRDSGVFDGVQGVRTKYNKGGLTRGQVPEILSHRYNKDGSLADPGVEQPAAKEAPKTAKAKADDQPAAGGVRPNPAPPDRKAAPKAKGKKAAAAA